MIFCQDKKIVEISVPHTGSNSRREYLSNLEDFGLQPRDNPHLVASEVSELIGPEEYAECYTYSVRRNPLEYMVSWYENSLKKAAKSNRPVPSKMQKGFNKWINRLGEDPDSPANAPHLSNHTKYWQNDNGEIIVDNIILFEDRKSEFLDIVGSHGGDITLTLKKKVKSLGHKRFMNYYNMSTAEIVRQRFALDVEILGIPPSWKGW